MNHARVSRAMGELGFTASEAKVYAVLLKQHPATGYEVAARSGVPRSAIYNILKKLESVGLVNAAGDKPARYVPLPPERLYELLGARFSRSLDDLKTTLASFVKAEEGSSLWQIRGWGALIDNATGLVGRAKKSLCASLWRREAAELAAPLAKASAAGVRVVLFSFTDLAPLDRTLGAGSVFSYGLDEAALEKDWRHKLVLIADGHTVLVGGAEATDDSRATVTDDSAIVEMAQSNLVLDLTLYGQRFGTDTTDVVKLLATKMAPIDELLGKRGR